MHAFDTHKYIKELQGTGFKESQAEVIVKSLLESREYNFSKLATREQVAFLESSMNARFEAVGKEIIAVEERLDSKINTVKNELKAVEERLDFKINTIKNELKADIANSQLNILKWMIPFFVTIIGMIAGLIIKLL